MAKKKSKLATPAWILEGYDSIEEYNKSKGINNKKKIGKLFKIRKCPKCNSKKVGLILSGSDSEEGGGNEWKCSKCGWSGENIKEEELNEEELIKQLDKIEKGGEK